MRLAPFVAAAVALVLLAPGPASAGSARWSGAPASNNWNSAGNWAPITVPDGPSDTATFATSNRTAVSLTAETQLNGVVFSQGASPFTITQSSFLILTISGAGITNDSGTLQNFVLSSQSSTELLNSATVENLTRFTINGGSASSQIGSVMIFRNTSSAGGGAFICNGGTIEDGFGGVLQFRDNSTADHATFTTTGGMAFNAYGGRIFFEDTSTAGNATFMLRGADTVYNVQFDDSSTAGNATFMVYGGSSEGNAGSLLFWDTSTASNATITASASTGSNFGGSTIDFDSAPAPATPG